MTLTKVKTKTGIKWKALVRKGGKSKSKTFLSKSNAKEWGIETEKRIELSSALNRPDYIMTLADLAVEYMEAYKGKDHTREQRVRFWVDRIGNVRLTDIRPYLIKTHLNEYQAGKALSYGGVGPDLKTKTRTLDKKRSPASRNRMKASLAALLSYAREMEYLSGRIVTSDVTTVPENNKRTRFLTKDERKRLLKACRDLKYDRLYLLVIMALTSGCRQGELYGLRWEDINIIDESIYLHRTKNKNPRLVPLAQPALDELEKFRDRDELEKFRDREEWLVFPGKRKTYRPFTGARKHWLEAVKQANIKNFKFHDLRHDFASTLAMNGSTLNEIADLLGCSIQNAYRYSHLSSKHKRKVIKRTFG